MTRMGDYDHLNEESKVVIPLDMEDVVRGIVKMNYGVHRFLSCLVKVRRELAREMGDEPYEGNERKMLIDGIEELLNKGGY